VRRRLVAALVAAVLVAGCGGAPSHIRAASASKRVVRTPTTDPATSAEPAAPRVHAFAAATGVPWSSVGPGWFLVAVDGKTTRLLLVDPTGHHYPVYTAGRSGMTVTGWSGDGQRVLLQQLYTRRPQPTYVVDLRTGREWQPRLPAHASVFGFTAPNGLGLLTAAVTGFSSGSPSGYRIERRGLDGGDPVALSSDLVAEHGEVTPNAVYLPSGTALVVGEAGRLVLVDNATGQPVHAIPGSSDCTSRRMWDATHVLAGCPHGLTLLSITDGPGRILVRPHSNKGPDYDDVDVWSLGGALYTRSLGACGYEFVGRVDADGHVHEMPIPHTVGNTIPLAVWNGRLAVQARQGCEGPDAPSLLWFDPSTGAEQVLWSPQRGDEDVQILAQ